MHETILPFTDMAKRHPGLTDAIAGCYAEAARVCLDRHHKSPILFAIGNGNRNLSVTARWDETDSRIKAAWANETDTTEAGGYAFAIAAVEVVEGLVAVRRAETRTGADYYIALAGTEVDDLEDCMRLEVSATDAGAEMVIDRRLSEKVEQTRRGTSNLPALATVVGFKARLVKIERVV